MLYKNTLLLLLFIVCTLNAFSAVFVVTSNADAGPGTLREALTLAAANGVTDKDYINFNIADLSVAGRTIVLLSDLPTINSDMIIDGSTQPGANLSINGAKIVIQGGYHTINNVVDYINYFLIKNVNDVEIDGLIIKGAPDVPGFYNSGRGSAITIDGTNKTITIGQAGKGNVFYDNYQTIECSVGASYYYPNKSQTDNVVLKNNLIGVKEDGVTVATAPQSSVIFNYVFNAVVGGDTPQEGNVFYCIFGLSPNYINDQIAKDVNYKVRNNIFAANSLQQIPANPVALTSRKQLYASIGASDNVNYTANSTVDIRDNVFGCELSMQGFQKLSLQIQHNFFGISSDKLTNLPMAYTALHLGYMQGTLLIGGADISKGNIFTNCAQDTASVQSAPVVWIEDYTQPINPLFKVELSHNSFYCNNNIPLGYSVYYDKKPVIPLSVDNLTGTVVNGTAVPNARVELYYTDYECKQCQPKTYLTTVNANSSGKWSYTGSLLPGYGVMASATLNQLTSEFTDTRVYYGPNYIQVTGSDCVAGGSIKGLFTANAKNIKWVNIDTHQIISNNTDLTNAPPGKYRLVAEQFGCVAYSDVYEITDMSPKVYDQSLKITHPSCGNGGSISGLYIGYVVKTEWLDATNKIIGNQLNINNLLAGTYTLRVTSQTGCTTTYGPITLTNTTGPNINQTAATIQGSNCGTSTGSITNITATGTGTLTYSWKNSQQQVVATTNDLLNQPAGNYTLQVSDQSSCGPVSSSEITIPELNGIAIDDSQIVNTPAMCQSDNGSITGIVTTGATGYKWIDGTGNVVSTQPNLTGAIPGSYYLLAVNATCSKQSSVYTITRQTNTTNYGGLTKKLTNATCDFNNGSIEVIFTDAPTTPLPAFYRWANSAGQTVGTNSRILSNIDAGTYQLYVSDVNGCERFLISYAIGRTPGLTVVSDNVQIINDHCETSTGSITGIGATGKTPLNLTWTDAAGNTMSNAANLSNVKAGTYTLKITDGSGCEQDLSYTIQNENSIVPMPKVANLQLCGTGQALLSVSAPSAAYSYRLYDSGTSTTPIDTQASGIFKITASANRSYYISQYTGNCESDRAEIKVTLGITKLGLSNTFTPNNDGINDTWKINGMENYPNATVQIYNRNGQVVYESKGYTLPFDGHMNGHDLPIGTYYYMINLNSKCDLISGNLTIVR